MPGLSARGGIITLSNQLALTNAPVGSARSSITLAAGVTLDARGIWTNAVLDPEHVAGEAFAHGGTVTIQGDGAVALAAGSSIDVSSGGALLPGGKLLQAAAGSISVTADIEPLLASTSATAAVTLAADFVGYGSSGGGTLSLEAPAFHVGGTVTPQDAADVVTLASSLFQSGFSSYVINGTSAVTVAADEQVTAVEPIYTLGAGGGSQVPTGGDPEQVFSVILPGIYTPSRGGDTVAQRGGASVTLLSSIDPSSPGGGGGTGVAGHRLIHHRRSRPGDRRRCVWLGLGTRHADRARRRYHRRQQQLRHPGRPVQDRSAELQGEHGDRRRQCGAARRLGRGAGVRRHARPALHLRERAGRRQHRARRQPGDGRGEFRARSRSRRVRW